jgi:hypothetical protein
LNISNFRKSSPNLAIPAQAGMAVSSKVLYMTMAFFAQDKIWVNSKKGRLEAKP